MMLSVYSVLLVALPFLTFGKPFVSYAGLGDSYPAGLGTESAQTSPSPDATYAWSSNGYPVLIAQQLHLAFRNLAFGGSVTKSVLKLQVPLVGDSDVVSIQVGGNEVDFFALLNECVQQWKPLSTCKKEVDRARGIIQSTAFIDSFDDLLSGAKSTFRHDTKLLVLGYSRFFNDRTEQCNHASFSWTDPTNFLTQGMRRMFNRIVSDLNAVIQGVSEAHGSIYVDIDPLFEGHRFCEDGAIEPNSDASWFFNDVVTVLQESHMELSQHFISSTRPESFLNLTRTFHPKIEGHRAIANHIIDVLRTMQN